MTESSEFIQVIVDKQKCKGAVECGKCLEYCPVTIFRRSQQLIEIADQNEDECTLCYLCIDKCPHGAIEIRKLY